MACSKNCPEIEYRSCFRAVEKKDNNMVDAIEGTDIVANCVVEEYLKDKQLWEIYTEYTYSKDDRNLYEMPFLFATLIHFFEMDRNAEIEARRKQ